MIVLIIDDKSIKKVKPKKEEETVSQEKLPKYVIPSYNFMNYGHKRDASILGVPCKVISEMPYYEPHSFSFSSGSETAEVMRVQSLLTGIEYTIPTELYAGYNTIEEVIKNTHIPNFTPDKVAKSVESIIGRKYYPKDNSFIIDFNDMKKHHTDLINKECKVISLPFTAKVEEFNNEYDFVLVEHNGNTYRTLFKEWYFMK